MKIKVDKCIAMVLCIGILGLSGCSAEEPKNELKEEEKAVAKDLAIGESGISSGVELVVNSIRVDEGLTPAGDGLQYTVLDVTMKNTNKEDTTISSMLCFELKDQDGRKQDLAITANLNGTTDTTIKAKESASGEIAFKTAVEGELKLTFKADLTSEGVRFIVR